jgi:hypothetical protein
MEMRAELGVAVALRMPAQIFQPQQPQCHAAELYRRLSPQFVNVPKTEMCRAPADTGAIDRDPRRTAQRYLIALKLIALPAASVSRFDGLMDVERPDAIVPQIAIIHDRIAFLARAVAPKASIGAEEVVIPLAPLHILCGRLMQSVGRLRLPRDGRRLH